MTQPEQPTQQSPITFLVYREVEQVAAIEATSQADAILQAERGEAVLDWTDMDSHVSFAEQALKFTNGGLDE